MNSYTLYRATKEFMRSLSGDHNARELWRRARAFQMEDAINASQELLSSGLLVEAARVRCEERDFFKVTSSAVNVWYEQDGVELLDERASLYSSSMGDIFYNDDERQFYYMSMTTFEKVNMIV